MRGKNVGLLPHGASDVDRVPRWEVVRKVRLAFSNITTTLDETQSTTQIHKHLITTHIPKLRTKPLAALRQRAASRTGAPRSGASCPAKPLLGGRGAATSVVPSTIYHRSWRRQG